MFCFVLLNCNGMVGRYFSVTLGKDLYGQSEDESCLGMLQGCVVLDVAIGHPGPRALT